jgi:hypothetical protein
MKKVSLLCGLLLALTAASASAAGVGLRWGACFGDAGPINKNFACNTNSGTNVLTCSFQTGEDILASSGQEVVIDIASAGATLPAWWAFKNAGTCRIGALGLNTVPTAGPVCIDWAVNGPATAGIGAYDIGARSPNTARIKIANAVQASALADIFAGQEYFSMNVTITNQKTVGTGSCAGCTTPVCIVFNSIKLTTQVAANDRTVSGPMNGTDADFATWQGGAGITVPPTPGNPGGSGCGGATPTQNKTWSQVKSLYR